ncbi:hypothetical protein BT63DRAFT_455280 [Microthyrium microscopicum]|uniref:Uncharacterized protein n=1 Tax=Microthyrium microscopicum TaxID=703497 RepID=A0A6A6UD56_9PEZI|nr:hypothetical protein BT63DRAFT_455280 [Microthyrium microscopicum]
MARMVKDNLLVGQFKEQESRVMLKAGLRQELESGHCCKRDQRITAHRQMCPVSCVCPVSSVLSQSASVTFSNRNNRAPLGFRLQLLLNLESASLPSASRNNCHPQAAQSARPKAADHLSFLNPIPTTDRPLGPILAPIPLPLSSVRTVWCMVLVLRLFASFIHNLPTLSPFSRPFHPLTLLYVRNHSALALCA